MLGVPVDKRLEVAGIQFDFLLKSDLPEAVRDWRDVGHQGYIAVVNPHSVMMAHRDAGMRRAISKATVCLPDGVGIVLAAKLLGYGRQHRVTGPALMLEMCDRGREFGLRHFFYGGGEGIAGKLAAQLSQWFPGLDVVGSYTPPFRPASPVEDAEEVARINSACPDVVWVGLGTAKQEKWMGDHHGRIRAAAMIGVGAAFDFHSGNAPWAPGWVRKYGLEWAYRLVREPRRMLKRNFDSPLFVTAVTGQRFRESLTKIGKMVRVRRQTRVDPGGRSAMPDGLDIDLAGSNA